MDPGSVKLENLPNEILTQVCCYLDVEDVSSMSNEIQCDLNYIYYSLIKRDIPSSTVTVVESSKFKYLEEYAESVYLEPSNDRFERMIGIFNKYNVLHTLNREKILKIVEENLENCSVLVKVNFLVVDVLNILVNSGSHDKIKEFFDEHSVIITKNVVISLFRRAVSDTIQNSRIDISLLLLLKDNLKPIIVSTLTQIHGFINACVSLGFYCDPGITGSGVTKSFLQKRNYNPLNSFRYRTRYDSVARIFDVFFTDY